MIKSNHVFDRYLGLDRLDLTVKDTIFMPSFGNLPDKIVGREKELASFTECLESLPGHRNRSMFIVGQRGMGKTALLLEMAKMAREKDFAVAKVTVGPMILAEIIELVQAEARQTTKGKRKLAGIGFNVTGTGVNVSFAQENSPSMGFRMALSTLCDSLAGQGRGVLLLVDEVQADSDEMKLLAITYQELVGEGRNIAIVMAGLPSSISHVLNEKVLTFLNRAKKFHLMPILEAKVKSYYASSFKRLGIDVNPEQTETLARTTKGFPYLLQLIGYTFVEEVEPGQSIDDETIADSIKVATKELVGDIFDPALAPLSDREMEILKVMAQVSKDGRVKTSDVVGKLDKDNNYFQPYRKRLIEHGVIDAPRRGELEFTLPYLAEYLKDPEGFLLK